MGSPASGARASADGDSETSARWSCKSPTSPRGPGLSSKRLMGPLSASLRPSCRQGRSHERQQQLVVAGDGKAARHRSFVAAAGRDRKSTRLNSSHGYISYAVFCLKKKKKESNVLVILYNPVP